jgi:hypothetical protein
MSSFKASTLVFVDPTVQDYQSLVNGMVGETKAILLDLNRDGIEQITNTIIQSNQVESIHIVSHGEAGNVYLGSARLSVDTLRRYASQLQSWKKGLTQGADILLYGCEVAANRWGRELVRQLSHLTGASVAASSSLTGSAALGGDWQLDVKIGHVKSPLVFGEEVMARYAFTLAPDAIPNLIYTVNNNKIFFTSIVSGGRTEPTSLATGSLIPNTLAFNTLAIARDPLSSTYLLYYIGSGTNNKLGSWDPITGAKADLGTITGAALQNSARMAFRDNGQIYVLNGNQLYTVSTGTGLGTGNSTPAGTATFVATLAGLPSGNTGDMAFDPANPNVLYITGSDSRGLYKVTFTGATPSAATLVGTMGNNTSPGLAFGPDGNLYGSNGNSLIRIDTTNASTTVVASVGTTINDFATLPILSPDVDLSVTITDSKTTAATGETITYTITVTNNSGYNVGGVSIVDNFTDPNLSGTPTWSAANATGVSFPTTADRSGTGNINVKVNLAAGASVTYTVTGLTVSGGSGNTISNTVTVMPPEGVTDKTTNSGVNSATDTTSISASDTTPPIVTVKTLITNDTTPDLTGTVDDETAKVLVTVNGTTYEATNKGDGTWFLAGTKLAPLPDGSYDIKAEAIDTLGNKGTDSTNNELIIDTQAPVVTVDGPKITNDKTPDLSGTVNDKTAKVLVTVNGTTYEATNKGDGTWFLAGTNISPLPNGTYDIKAEAVDTLGNEGVDVTTNELTVNTQAPVVTVDGPKATSDNTPDLTGKVDNKTAKVFITVNGKVYEATNKGDGTWFLAGTNISPLPNGTYDIKAEAIDTLGNKGTDNTTNELIVDTQAPSVTVDGPKITNDKTPDLGGTVNDKTAKVLVTVNGTTYEATNNGDGTWFLAGSKFTAPLPDAVYDVRAEAVDTLGNKGTDGTSNELTIDTQAPVVTVDGPKITNDSTPELTGTVDDPTAKVGVTVNGKTYIAKNNGNGTWTLANNQIKEALADGTYDVSVTATDRVNNVGKDNTTNELTINSKVPAVLLTPIDLSTGEDGSTGEFQVVLNSRPTANVILSFSSSDSAEGTPVLTTVTFTPDNWSTPQIVTIQGKDDALIDGNVSYAIQTNVDSDDPNYSSIDVPNITLTNFDNDTPGVTITPTSGLITSETGKTAIFTAVLKSQPTADVIINLSSSDLTEGTVPKFITFTATNWNIPQTVTITGVNDNLVDGNITYTIQTNISSSDSNYSRLNPVDVWVTNLDNERSDGGIPNKPPVAENPIAKVTPGKTINLSGLSATDPDGSIQFYTIITLPPPDQGTLFLGDPAAGGIPVVPGQQLTSAQIQQLFFQPTAGFTGSSFSYTATDNAGLSAATPATVSLKLNSSLLPIPSALPPVAFDVAVTLTPGSLTNIAGLLATDPDNAIAAYIISTLPSPDQGALFLGDPANGGTPITVGQRLTPDQINQLVFQSTGMFSGASFTYTAVDSTGVSDLTPATVTLSIGVSSLPSCQLGLRLRGTRKKDSLQGTPGGDSLRGMRGNDVLHGWGCNDVIVGGRGKDRLFGDEGQDVLKGGVGRDRLRGWSGTDVLNGGRGKDVVFGGPDNDNLKGRRHRDRLNGNEGDDQLYGGLGSDRMRGGSGNDFAKGRRGNDLLRGGHGNDVLRGNRGQDRMRGGSGDDILGGGLQRDWLNGNQGNDTLLGRHGRDLLRGRQGDDMLYGGLHRDILKGHQGRDFLQGGMGADRLLGGANDDVLVGDGNGDRLIGGSGRDRFVYMSLQDRGDRILDFDVTEDVIDLSRLFAKLPNISPQVMLDYVKPMPMGGNTVIKINGNGANTSEAVLVVLENVNANTLGKQNFLLS